MKKIKHATPKISKEVKPQVSFSKVLNIRKRVNTKDEIDTWENDGGNLNAKGETFEIIDGKVCDTPIKVMNAKIKKFIKNEATPNKAENSSFTKN